jgi:hypothetical protein
MGLKIGSYYMYGILNRDMIYIYFSQNDEAVYLVDQTLIFWFRVIKLQRR